MSKKPDNLDRVSTPAAVSTSKPSPARQSPLAGVKPGRPPKALTEVRLRRILRKVIAGMPPQSAAVSVGVPKGTWKVWLEKGRKPDAVEPYKSLVERLEVAIAMYQESLVQHVDIGMVKDPRVALNVLERRFPEDWADPGRAGSVTVNLGVVLASPEWIDLRDRLLRALAGFPEALAAVTAELARVAPALEGEIVREIEAA